MGPQHTDEKKNANYDWQKDYKNVESIEGNFVIYDSQKTTRQRNMM